VTIRRILIANRGEIAARIIRTCRELGIETVLAASAADRDSVPAQLADRVVCIGPARPGESYLKVATIVHAALATRTDAIHPGDGLHAERAAHASRGETEGVVLIGPTAAHILA
jgi:acetyl-CoA carboxylase biotin carboxylase subunit